MPNPVNNAANPQVRHPLHSMISTAMCMQEGAAFEALSNEALVAACLLSGHIEYLPDEMTSFMDGLDYLHSQDKSYIDSIIMASKIYNDAIKGSF